MSLSVPAVCAESSWRVSKGSGGRARGEREVVLVSESVARVCTSSIIIKSRSDGGESPGTVTRGVCAMPWGGINKRLCVWGITQRPHSSRSGKALKWGHEVRRCRRPPTVRPAHKLAPIPRGIRKDNPKTNQRKRQRPNPTERTIHAGAESARKARAKFACSTKIKFNYACRLSVLIKRDTGNWSGQQEEQQEAAASPAWQRQVLGRITRIQLRRKWTPERTISLYLCLALSLSMSMSMSASAFVSWQVWGLTKQKA